MAEVFLKNLLENIEEKKIYQTLCQIKTYVDLVVVMSNLKRPFG